MIESGRMSICRMIVGCHAVVVLLLGNDLRMAIVMQSMGHLLMRVVVRLLLKPRGILRVLMLMRKDVMLGKHCGQHVVRIELCYVLCS